MRLDVVCALRMALGSVEWDGVANRVGLLSVELRGRRLRAQHQPHQKTPAKSRKRTTPTPTTSALASKAGMGMASSDCMGVGTGGEAGANEDQRRDGPVGGRGVFIVAMTITGVATLSISTAPPNQPLVMSAGEVVLICVSTTCAKAKLSVTKLTSSTIEPALTLRMMTSLTRPEKCVRRLWRKAGLSNRCTSPATVKLVCIL